MKEFFKLIRWPNLIIVAVTMILIRYAIIEPVIQNAGTVVLKSTNEEVLIALQWAWYDFMLLVAATVLITAAGYVINDYFDIKTDLINKGKVIVGTQIPRRQAMMWHNILNAIGVIIGFYISWMAGYIWMGMLFLVVSGLLYFYSASYKRQFLIGNLIVAVLTAMVPLLVIIYESPAIYKFYKIQAVSPPDLKILYYWVGGFALFAFLTTLIREIVKDIEDYEGDSAFGRNTLPIILGIKTSKIITASLILITIALLYLVWYFFINDKITILYLSLSVALPLVYVIYILFRGNTRKEFHLASRIIKVVMVTGMLYSLVVKAILTWSLFNL